ncbi:MAG TPA: 8-amino-7-oxononanoate synthase [Verrucomicrobiae bacterium]|nr:8-amino-7-oxononanoate synthase [Verrucomicrobiae bacterium]
MSGSFEHSLGRELESLRGQNLYRDLRRIDSPQSARVVQDGAEILNFSSNDYLGFANEPRLQEAARSASALFGAGAGASRLICGSLSIFHELEHALAAFKRTERAIVFSSGCSTALGVIPALAGRKDILIIDKLSHASIVDGARLSGATLRVFRHNDLNHLEEILRWANAKRCGPDARVVVATDSVFSMDGDLAPVREIVELKEKYGAALMLDEAHATGVIGAEGRGVADAEGVSAQVEIQMGTLGKALGSAGGYICGSRVLIEFLINRARSFVFSTAPVPAAAGAALAAIRLLQTTPGEERRTRLWSRIREFSAAVFPDDPEPPSAIIPLKIGAEDAAMTAARKLLEMGILLPAIRYPTVSRNRARLRIAFSAAHSSQDVQTLVEALRRTGLAPVKEPVAASATSA